ncbi:hypothetical protein [Pontiella sulfatireligans]|uniref:Glycine zipper domain-containing protein n=1 Tax=Pontiella sulfatireligans TaxID=2750658 RepID=A0A6C2UMI1_9BACT|nr:hypothetical protein [Pontiella sulfatireligans]VGO21133.1 hypothetical protein SCARR_03204 [Pontiella sulfatireligans]
MRYIFRVMALLLTVTMLASTGCKSKSAKSEGAKQGAASGSVGGAVGGFLWGLFTGNPLGGAAKGAAVGAGTGATMGALGGAKSDREMKAEFGESNYEALIALVHRDYGKAKTLVAQTANDPNPNYRIASAGISALIARETLSNEEMEPYYAKMIEVSGDVETREDAKVEIRLAQRDLKSMRKQFRVR